MGSLGFGETACAPEHSDAWLLSMLIRTPGRVEMQVFHRPESSDLLVGNASVGLTLRFVAAPFFRARGQLIRDVQSFSGMLAQRADRKCTVFSAHSFPTVLSTR